VPLAGTSLDQLMRTKAVVHIADDAASKHPSAPTRLAGARTILNVPMLKENELVGALIIYRKEVRPFTDQQIDLVTNFAAQAVIAIENARLLNELRQRTGNLSESLEQQTATSEVLSVISNSPGELQPVFDAMLENAVRICDAKCGLLFRFDGDFVYVVATVNAPPALQEFISKWGRHSKPIPGTAIEEILKSKAIVHRFDDSESGVPTPASAYGGARTWLGVPLLNDETLVGAIIIYRQEVRPFGDKQIELLSNFAAQAVIAIENTRLLNELRESLQQQTATADVLKVISRSTFDLQTVLDTLTESATRLCRAERSAIRLLKDGLYHNVASYGFAPEHKARMEREPTRPGYDSIAGRVALERRTVQLIDAQADPDPDVARRSKSGNVRTMIGVPLLREGSPIGVLLLQRGVVQPFSGKEIELAETFADQAVIAIENVRLFDEVQARTRELSESLEQQTATSEVLKVISSSPANLEPVFQSMLSNALQICDAKFGAMFRFDGDENYPVAEMNSPPALKEWLMQRRRRRSPAGQSLHRLLETKQVYHVIDDLISDNPSPPARLAGARTHLAVPMLKDNELVGAIIIYRQEVRPFTDKQIDLVKNFAAQAVIAIENTRLLNELRHRTDDLSEALEQQTATSEVLSVISSSPGELQPVFDSILGNATRICEAGFGVLHFAEGEVFRTVAMHNAPHAYVEAKRHDPIVRHFPSDSALGQIKLTKHPVQIADVRAEPAYHDDSDSANATRVSFAHLTGVRSLLGIPILREGVLVGAIIIYRKEVRPFSERQIALVQNFAAQAVIAIENTRLLNELRQRTDDLTESLEQQTATSEVLKVISSSPGELAPVFQAMLENATRICGAKFGVLHRYDDGAFLPAAMVGVPPGLADAMRQRGRHVPAAGLPLDRLLRTKQAIHTVDQAKEQVQPVSATIGGARSHIAVPMLKGGEVIGALTIYRTEVRPFTDKQIELVQNFAAQAVIAIENTRRPKFSMSLAIRLAMRSRCSRLSCKAVRGCSPMTRSLSLFRIKVYSSRRRWPNGIRPAPKLGTSGSRFRLRAITCTASRSWIGRSSTFPTWRVLRPSLQLVPRISWQVAIAPSLSCR
jgi:GAF domain-containing protein